MTEQRAVCPTCGGPVTIDAETIPGVTVFIPERFDPPKTVLNTRTRYTYAPPALTEAERAVVEAAASYEKLCRDYDTTDSYVFLLEAYNTRQRTVNALLAARAAAMEATP